MADNYLERHQEEYEFKKRNFLRKKKHLPKVKHCPPKPEDDAL